MRYIILFLLATLNISAQYVEIEDQSELTVLTPSLKNRKTAKIRLANGMNIYLISDPQTDQSAAALAVQAGSWQDPSEYPGMAHFLEHMLFMGTKPYPSENDFSKYISNHAGKQNAYTMPDRTVYMFSVSHNGFEGALDRFSHFFIDPLFNPKEVNSELLVVDQEHAKNLENDDWRLYMVSKEIGNQNHPNAKFSTGNSETLSKIPNSALKKWFKDNYSSHLMQLVIYSNKPIDELKNLVDSKFSLVKTNNKNPFYTNQKLGSRKQKNTLIHIKPIKNTQKIYIEWELPRSFANDKTKTAELLAYTLDRGQKYSLEEILRSKNLIELVSVDVERVGKHHAVFQISIELTEQGIKNKENVIKHCLDAFDSVRSAKVPSYLFKEKQTIAKLNYQYQERTDAFNFVKMHAHKLIDEHLETYPQNTVLATGYNHKKMQKLLNFLTIDNAHIYIIAAPEKAGVLLDHKEKWMGCEYGFTPITTVEIEKYSQKSPNSSIRIPPPNPFIPSSLKLLKSESINTGHKIVADDDFGKVFYLKDNEFQVPEVSLHLHILSPALNGTARSNVLAELFIQHFNYKLNPVFNCAASANIAAASGVSRHRINFIIEGFSEKISLFVEEVFKEITSLYPTEQEFITIKNQLKKDYENFSKELPVIQAIVNMKSILASDINTKEEMLKSLQEINYEDYLAFQNNLFQKTYLEGFFAGNLTLKDAEGIYSDIRHFLSINPYPRSEHLNRRVFSLAQCQKPHLVESSTNVSGHGIILTIDQGSFSFQKRASQEILGQIIHESFFDTLRTKQKTAYIARAWPFELEKRLFMNFAVQSSTHESLDLLYRFELFLEDFVSSFSDEITEDRFNTIKLNQIEKLEASMKNLSIKSATLDKLAFEYQDLDWIDKRIKGLQEISFDSFKKYCLETLSKTNTKRLAVLINGTSPENFFTYERKSLQSIGNSGEYVEITPVVNSK